MEVEDGADPTRTVARWYKQATLISHPEGSILIGIELKKETTA